MSYKGQSKNSELFHLESRIKLLEKILPTALANVTSPYGITAHLGAMNHFGSYNMPPPEPYYAPSYPHMEYNSVFSQNGGSRDSSLRDCEGLSLSDTRTDASDADTSLHDDKAPSQVSTVVTTPVSVPQDFNTETPSQVDSGDSSIIKSSSAVGEGSSMAATVNPEKPPLPAINKSQLLKPDQVVAMHPNLVRVSCIPRLSVKLAKDSFFGTELMAACTVRGLGNFHALPKLELKQLKQFLCTLCVPRLLTTHIEFEQIWKNCVESIGQACKAACAKKR